MPDIADETLQRRQFGADIPIDQAWTQVIVWPGTLSISMTDPIRCNVLNRFLTDLQHTEVFHDQPLKFFVTKPLKICEERQHPRPYVHFHAGRTQPDSGTG